MTAGPTSAAWSWRHAFAQSDLPATTKHVLHTLGMFMNELGEGCYPSVADICRYSGLDKKTVLKHLAAAREAGWIAVSQHGYRGQRWKRQEYAARWPERDLVAACAPDDGEEGGGAVPPPSGAPKVVEPVPEGGGIEGSKVVEQLHQDKTSPVTPPDTSPTGRAPERAREGEIEDRKKIEAAYWRMIRVWPKLNGLPKDTGLKAFMALSPEDREIAERRFPNWLAALKAQGKDHVHQPSTYFGKRLFDDIADPQDAPPEPVLAAPFGKAYGAFRMAKLLEGPEACATIPALTFMERRLVDDGAADEAALMTEKVRRYGFPTVNRLHDAAADRRSVTLPPEWAAHGELTEPVRVGSDLWQAWQAEHERRGWPWLPEPGRVEWVYFPAGGPGGLGAFEAAIRGGGRNDDGGGREAAE